MKCNHCNAQPMKSCSNTECVYFGKPILPAEAQFCPKCGFALTGTAVKEKDISMFFPIKGLYPDSKLSDVLINATLYDKLEIEGVGCNRTYVKCVGCSVFFTDDRLDSINLFCDSKMPLHLSKLGFSWTSSIEEWIRLLKQLKFTVLQIRKHVNSFCDGIHYQWFSQYVATAFDQSVKIMLLCDEGCEVMPSECGAILSMSLVLPCYVDASGGTYQNYELNNSYGDPIKQL